ncbi:Caspase recruitment domain-containing protein 6 [Tupaia chinensis]|uniref:Caspase recruitment domain-containing protein 6 n=1 Tax=Tupaia chinensis TaxID=246437 RepID=L8Y8K2_TUPCH|nr:Caspase recruitment domain-containing protein 6 [Tupaia chinensis]
MSFKEKDHLGLETSEFFWDEETTSKETAFCSRENEKEDGTPSVALPCLAKGDEHEVPEIITYSRIGQGYEPDDFLYLGEEEYLESAGYPEDTQGTVEEDYDDPENRVYYGKEDRVYYGEEDREYYGEEDREYYGEEDRVYYGKEDAEYSETNEFSDEEQSYEDSETSISLEGEEEKSMEDRKCGWTPKTSGDLVWNFLMKVQALDVTARDSILRPGVLDEDSEGELLTRVENLDIGNIQTINPLDVLCASMLCSDSSLQCEVMLDMYQCQFALPLLLPDAENNKSILMLGAMKDIVYKHSTQSSGGPTEDTEQFLALMKMPIISFVRLGYCSFSKSRILNTLLRPAQLKSHKTFLHQDTAVLVLPRQISDGLVEITWCFPDSNNLKENSSIFQKPVAMTNLRGDLESSWTQFGFLMEVSSAVFFFTDCLGEKEWDMLMFLGEDALERCYFVFSSQARESEETQIFQSILKLKPSQLLFWEGEEAETTRENMEGLHAALQQVMCSSLRYVSVEDMASLARELGIQVDRDFENAQGIQVFPREKMAGIAEGEEQQRHSQPKSSSENQAQMPIGQSEATCEVSQNLQNLYHSPVVMPHMENCWSLPTRVGANNVSLKAPWVMSSHLGLQQRYNLFHPLPFQNARAYTQCKNFGIRYFQPQRFYLGERFIKFPRIARGHHVNRTFGRPPRPISQCAQAFSERSQTMGALKSSGTVVSQVGHFYSMRSQPAGTVGKLQLKQTCTQRTESTVATGKCMRKPSPIQHPHPQSFQPAKMQKPLRPTSQQRAQLKTPNGPSNPTIRTGCHPMSENKLLPCSQFKYNQHKPFHIKHPKPKPSQPVPSQAKPSQTNPPQPHSSQARPSLSKPTQPKPCQPQPCQSKSSQPRPTQPKSAQTNPSQVKAYCPRAGPKRVGKR